MAASGAARLNGGNTKKRETSELSFVRIVIILCADVLIRPFARVEYMYQSIREGKFVSPRSSIFVIEDDPSMIRSIERLLMVYQFDVKAFESAEAFLDYANPCDASCLVLDINLGGMSGIELSRKLALSGISIPVIFITGKDSEIVRKAALEVGCSAYLPKPFPAKQLMDAIDKALDGRGRDE